MSEAWTESFQIPASLRQQWEQDSSKSKGTFLAWCLRHNKIDEGQYLRWAARTYSLPIVKKEFFKSAAIRENWQFGKFDYQWSAELLPLEEWDGIVRIACLEPPQNFNLGKGFCFVLAPLTELNKTWESFFPQVAQTSVAATPAPEALEIAAEPETFELAPADLSGPSTVAAAVPTEVEFDPENLFKGFSFAPSDEAGDLNAESEQSESSEEGSAEHSEGESSEDDGPPVMPDGFVIATGPIDIPMPVFKKPGSAATSLNTPVAPQPETTSAQAAPVAKATLPSFETPSFTQRTHVLAQEIVPEEIAEAQTLSGIDIPALPVEEPSVSFTDKIVSAHNGPGPVTTELAPPDFDQCQNLDELSACAFKKMETYFTHSMVLLFENNELKPARWNVNFNSKNSDHESIRHDLPSIFRIVNSTGLPYHGYLKPCEVNDQFFTKWLKMRSPAHATMVPFVVGGQVAGMLLGTTNEALNAHAALSEMEQWAEASALQFAQMHTQTLKQAA